MTQITTTQRTTKTLRALTYGLAGLVLGVGLSAVVPTVSAKAGPAAAAPAVTAPVAPPVARPDSYSPIVDAVAPAVVTIRVEKKVEASPTDLPLPFGDFFGQGRRMPRGGHEGALGSGVVIAADGVILTNHHVIDHGDKIRVDLADGRSFPATLVGSDEASDLAVLRVKAQGLPTVPFGDSDQLKVGDVVLAFGNPLGVGQTVTMGIVSAKGRATGVSDGSYEDFLQTDAPINQGNSGGALVNLKGELVGINAQIVSPSGGNVGLGFAIPSSMAKAVSAQLSANGVVRRAKLGVTVQGVTPELAESLGLNDAHGALVSGVEDGGPAAKAGLKQGDVIVSVDGRPVTDANQVRNQIASATPGSKVAIEVKRNGRSESLSATLVEREAQKVARGGRADGDDDATSESGYGMSLTPLTPQLAAELRLPRQAAGLVVTEVDPSGRAAAAGIQAGDLIKSVDGTAVESVSSLRTVLRAHTAKPALVLVTRQGADAFVALPRADA